jgi:hypothetical protein
LTNGSQNTLITCLLSLFVYVTGMLLNPPSSPCVTATRKTELKKKKKITDFIVVIGGWSPLAGRQHLTPDVLKHDWP